MIHEFTYSLEEVKLAAHELMNLQEDVSIYTFHGDLGAGKTTLIQALLEVNGIRDAIPSPTYNYVNIYTNQLAQQFYHFDLYRIDSIEQFNNFGFNEYLYAPNSWSFIEWPEIIEPLLKNKVCKITIQKISEDKRKLLYIIV